MYERLGGLLSEALERGSLQDESSSESEEDFSSVVPASLHSALAVFDLPINASFERIKAAYQERLDLYRKNMKDSAPDDHGLTRILDAYEALSAFFAGGKAVL